jgi:hypothetical protein
MVVAVAAVSAGTVADASAGPQAPAQVLFVGDSVPLRIEQIPEAAWALEQGMSVVSELAICRRLLQPSCASYETGIRPTTAYEVVSDVARTPTVVVMSIGYNDPPPQFAAGADAVMRKLTSRGVRHVIWVTLRDTHPQSAAVNHIIFGLQRRWPGVSVLDWNTLSTGEQWFDDEIHLNTAGAMAMARLIRARVLAACGTACLAPPRPPLQPLPSGSRICPERVGGDWVAVLATASSASQALALERAAIAKGFDQSLIVQSTPTVWQIALFGFPTRAAAVNEYLEMKSRGFRETISPNVGSCSDETGTWTAIFGRAPAIAAARALLTRIRAAGFKDGSRVENDQPGNYAVEITGFQSTKQLSGFAQEALRAGFVVSFEPS